MARLRFSARRLQRDEVLLIALLHLSDPLLQATVATLNGVGEA
jgi:hypothetical protein